jgi:hypothetical protein
VIKAEPAQVAVKKTKLFVGHWAWLSRLR